MNLARALHCQTLCLAASTVVLLVFVAACTSSKSGDDAGSSSSPDNGGSSRTSASTINIGVIGAFSGALASSATPVRDGVLAWMKTVNAAGGLNGHPVKAFVADDKADPAASSQALRTLVETDHVIALVGVAAQGTEQVWGTIYGLTMCLSWVGSRGAISGLRIRCTSACPVAKSSKPKHHLPGGTRTYSITGPMSGLSHNSI